MLNIVLFGPPGAGKGTQSARLIEKYKLIHLSTGDIFRQNIKESTALGKLAKSYIDQGNLVPDGVTIRMLEAEVEKAAQPAGFIFDGFPRTEAQAEALDKLLESKNTAIHLMLALNVPEEELAERLLLRGVDGGRADDQDESIIRNRIRVYNEQTSVLASYYGKQGKFFAVDGVGEISEIFQRLTNIIEQAEHGRI